jgi:CRISPR/Cas system-associated endoribonuclease Cas2
MLTPVQLTSLQSDLREIIEGDEDQVLFVSLAASDGRNENLIISSLGLPYTERAVLTII